MLWHSGFVQTVVYEKEASYASSVNIHLHVVDWIVIHTMCARGCNRSIHQLINASGHSDRCMLRRLLLYHRYTCEDAIVWFKSHCMSRNLSDSWMIWKLLVHHRYTCGKHNRLIQGGKTLWHRCALTPAYLVLHGRGLHDHYPPYGLSVVIMLMLRCALKDRNSPQPSP